MQDLQGVHKISSISSIKAQRFVTPFQYKSNKNIPANPGAGFK